MSLNRIRIAKDKAELVQSLVNTKDSTGTFQTYADVIIFAAALGAKYQKRIPIQEVSKEPAPINMEIFISRGYDRVIKLLAIDTTNDPNVISVFDKNAEEQRNLIFEEYANGGLEKLREELRGAVDYTERLLLILSTQRLQTEEIIEEDFDLTRFL